MYFSIKLPVLNNYFRKKYLCKKRVPLRVTAKHKCTMEYDKVLDITIEGDL